jgi:DNA sulfur modification protein DndD
MVKVSKRELFFVFDTPLARLDKQNRKNFITQIIKKISDQSIVLSTDSEFVDVFFDLIDSSIAKKYKLDYQDDLRKSTVFEGYFLESLNE